MKRIVRLVARPLGLRVVVLTLAALAAGGCFSRKPAGNHPAGEVPGLAGHTNLVINPIASPMARVVSVNAAAKFAVLSFPVGQIPSVGTRLTVFHEGQKRGELRISGPQEDTFTVGDITSGSVQVGDEVRAE